MSTPTPPWQTASFKRRHPKRRRGPSARDYLRRAGCAAAWLVIVLLAAMVAAILSQVVLAAVR